MTQPPYQPPTPPEQPAPIPQPPVTPPVAVPPAPPALPVTPASAPAGTPDAQPSVPSTSRPPLRSSRSVQGNVLAAFNKDHQAFRLVALPADAARARAWLAGMLPQLAVTEDVEDWNDNFSAARRRNGGDDPDLHVVWVNLSLTTAGLNLLAVDPNQVTRDLAGMSSLLVGPAARASALGDTGPSDPANWLFGGPGQPTVHAVVTVAADRPEHLAERQSLLDLHDNAHGVVTVFVQTGETLPGDQAGHEHFGFKDGISQPGVIGFHEPGPNGDRAGHPGTRLVDAGQFVYGSPGAPPAPAWLNDGSALVMRRLEQDVAAWTNQLVTLAGEVSSPHGPMTPDQLGALLMGRHKDGTPLAAPTSPDRGLGDDQNDFDYANDPPGLATPCPAHIRKTNPRAFASSRRIMRRGIPFGSPFDVDPSAKRGLVFNCHVTSIENQFEFIQQSWANNAEFSAGTGPTGPDPIIGTDGPLRLALADGSSASLAVKRAVTTAGALYALTLSLPTLKLLAQGAPLGA